MNAVKRTLLLEVMKLVDANWSLDPNEMELMKFINFKGAFTIETVMFYISGFFFVFFCNAERTEYTGGRRKNNWNLFEALKLGQVALHASLVNIECFLVL